MNADSDALSTNAGPDQIVENDVVARAGSGTDPEGLDAMGPVRSGQSAQLSQPNGAHGI